MKTTTMKMTGHRPPAEMAEWPDIDFMRVPCFMIDPEGPGGVWVFKSFTYDRARGSGAYLMKKKGVDSTGNAFLLTELPYIWQECPEVPTYTVALPWPRKPPWPKHFCGSSNTHKNTTINSFINLIPLYQSSRITQRLYARMTDTMDKASHWSFHPICPSDWVTTRNPEASHFKNALPIAFDSFAYVSNPVECASAASFVPRPKRPYDSMLVKDDPETVRKRKHQKRYKDNDNSQNLNMPKAKRDSSDESGNTSLVNTELQDEEAPNKRLACPFLKHNQARYGKVTTCLGSWPDIPRLKEHIYRKHASDQYRCSRCLTKCESHSQLREHQRADPPCSLTARDSLHEDQLDDLQIAEIKKRSRRGTNVEKWNSIYRIIFRLDADAQLPSPFWENITVGPTVKDYEPDTLSQFEKHLRRQLTTQNAAEIQTCLNYIQGFLQTPRGSSSSSSQSDSEYESQYASELPFLDSDSSDGHSQQASNAETDTDYSSLLQGINVNLTDDLDLDAEVFTKDFDLLFGLPSNVGNGGN
ncbi:hypothetical protein F5Y18DRAFT_217610 [Xylariaceae sp. FL1019]|nr:hypothetical protein F5Y18DRAFT_217610 [Xylariaceae sp. FL1019]